MTASFPQSNSRMVLLGDGQRRESCLDPAWRWPFFRLLKSLSSLSESGLAWNGRRKMQCGNISAMSKRGRIFTRPSKEGLRLRLPFGHSLLVGMNARARRGGPPLRPSVCPSVGRWHPNVTNFVFAAAALSPSPLISHSRCMTRWRSKWRGRKSRT